MKQLRRFLLVFVAVLVALVVVGLRPVSASATYTIKETIETETLPQGVQYFRETGTTTYGGATRNQYSSHLLIPKDADVELIPWAIVGKSEWNKSTIRATAHDYENKHPGTKVIAAVNGSFFDINGKRDFKFTPSGLHIAQGHTYYGETNGYRPLTFQNIEGVPRVRSLKVNEAISKGYFLTIYDAQGAVALEVPVDHLNAEPAEGATAVFYGIWKILPGMSDSYYAPQKVTGAYIVENGEHVIPAYPQKFYGIGQVSLFSEAEVRLLRGQFGIKTNNAEVQALLVDNPKIRVQERFVFNHNGTEYPIDNSLSANRIYLSGDPAYDAAGPDAEVHPRTVVGITATGDVLLSVIDGRQSDKLMDGVSGFEAAEMLKSHGATWVWNLDGGGSSTLIIQDGDDFRVTNSPSDGSERRDSNGLLVVIKMPDVNITTVEQTLSSAKVKVEITNPHGIDVTSMFMKVGALDTKYPIGADGTVEFTDLGPNASRTLNLWGVVNGKETPLGYSYNVMTLKEPPVYNSFSLSETETDFTLMFDITDAHAAITRLELHAGGEVHPVDGRIFIGNKQTFVNEAVSLNIFYNDNGPAGEVELTQPLEIEFAPTLYVPELSELLPEITQLANDCFKRLFE